MSNSFAAFWGLAFWGLCGTSLQCSPARHIHAEREIIQCRTVNNVDENEGAIRHQECQLHSTAWEPQAYSWPGAYLPHVSLGWQHGYFISDGIQKPGHSQWKSITNLSGIRQAIERWQHTVFIRCAQNKCLRTTRSKQTGGTFFTARASAEGLLCHKLPCCTTGLQWSRGQKYWSIPEM